MVFLVVGLCGSKFLNSLVACLEVSYRLFKWLLSGFLVVCLVCFFSGLQEVLFVLL